jgi:hypothetical protein
MKQTLIVIVCLAMSGCVSRAVTPVGWQRDKIIEVGKRELNRRHIHLPKDCEIIVDEGVYVTSVEPKREEYFVLFKFIYNGKRDVIYKVGIDKRSMSVCDFVDYREAR